MQAIGLNAATPALIPVERRQHVRLGMVFPALISVPGGELQPCTVLDLSVGGGRVRFDEGIAVPDAFTLFFTPSGNVRRSCRVVWRRDNFVGVAFSGRFDAVD